MIDKCKICNGTGKKIVKYKPCPVCGGTGYVEEFNPKAHLKNVSKRAKYDLDLAEVPCKECKGTGKVPVYDVCDFCGGSGKIVKCDKCGKIIGKYPQDKDKTLCPKCQKEEEERRKNLKNVYEVDELCTFSDIEEGKLYKGTVSRIERYGIFISLNEQTRGLLRPREMVGKRMEDFNIGDEVIVQVIDVRPDKREIDFRYLPITNYNVVKLEKEVPLSPIKDIACKIIEMKDEVVHIQGEVIQIVQTPGPTVFTVTDGTDVAWVAAIEIAGLRAHPEVKVGDIIDVIGRVSIREGKLQIERIKLRKLEEDEAREVKEKIEAEIERKSEPARDIEFLVKSEVLEKLRPKMADVAKRIRRAILDGKPIIIRHHADTDGYCGGLALERAILPIIQEFAIDEDAQWHFFKRRPSKAPFYELEDVTKDLVFSIEDHLKFGQKLPLIILVDNGSTDEDIPAISKAKAYGIEVIVIDHHFPGEVIDGKVEVDEYVDAHVNPYLVGGDSNLTAGVLATEIARMINPNVSESIKHLPGIAVVGDHAKGEEVEEYIKIALERINELSKKYGKGNSYDREYLEKISLCMDFEAFYLRFMDGKGIVDDILGVNNEEFARHERLIEILHEQAMKMVDRQMKAVLPAIKTTELENGIILNVLDVEKYAHKFTFPAPGKTCGFAHDFKVQEFGEDRAIITLAYGPDFGVVRATDAVHEQYDFNLNLIVEQLMDEIPEASLDGGGHECAGSLKFVEGLRERVLNRFIEIIKSMKQKQ
ncbi:DHH family phosphoesterase [Methanotorris formicicus]|uniref:Phosphoesterase RecJ domain protein n=1 Tax=Methanotorris formicicus Mc-S-70 TaxID=647171 RepID=H1KX68_9EURY|nr:DHH family phosphoesterase [Methanotorris formicicus]EHP88593.1 phosphoesterase RecJ domain protein [Methanotorris formicicus Mc-S-70]